MEPLRADVERIRNSVTTRLNELVSQYDQRDEMEKTYRGNPQLMSQVELGVLEDQVVDWLLERAKIKDKKTSFGELMKFDSA